MRTMFNTVWGRVWPPVETLGCLSKKMRATLDNQFFLEVFLDGQGLKPNGFKNIYFYFHALFRKVDMNMLVL